MSEALDDLRRAIADLLRVLADEVEPVPEIPPWRVRADLAFLDFTWPTPDPPTTDRGRQND